MNKAIYIGAAWCGMCQACRPQFEEQCKRLNVQFEYKDVDEADKGKETELGEQRHLPYAILSYNGKTLKGSAWDVLDEMKRL